MAFQHEERERERAEAFEDELFGFWEILLTFLQ